MVRSAPVCLALTVALVGLGTGCDGVSDPGLDAGAKAIDIATLERLGDALGAVDCARRSRCELPEDRFVDEGACASAVSGALVVNLQELAARGTVTVDGDAIERCAATLSAAGCDMNLAHLNALCPDAVRGSVSAGQYCTDSLECAGDAVCAEDPDDVCDTSCRPRSETTECLADVECPRGEACLGDPGACVALGGNGDACGDGELPECGRGLVCAGADIVEGLAGVCQTLTSVMTETVGARCDPEALVLCAPGLVCAVDGCDGLGCTHRCAEAPERGAPCTLGFVPADPCPAGQYCRAGVDHDDDDPIEDEDELAALRGACAPLPGPGEDCAEGACAAGLSCVLSEDGLSERCAAPLEVGASCTDDDACATFVCADGVCTEPRCEDLMDEEGL